MLIETTYFSIATIKVTKDVISQILREAVSNNEKTNITGILLSYENFFCQTIEGEQKDILTLMTKLRKDPRHRDVTTLHQSEISNRGFEKWMGFKVVDSEEFRFYVEALSSDFSASMPTVLDENLINTKMTK